MNPDPAHWIRNPVYRSKDLDPSPSQNVTAPEHCYQVSFFDSNSSIASLGVRRRMEQLLASDYHMTANDHHKPASDYHKTDSDYHKTANGYHKTANDYHKTPPPPPLPAPGPYAWLASCLRWIAASCVPLKDLIIFQLSIRVSRSSSESGLNFIER